MPTQLHPDLVAQAKAEARKQVDKENQDKMVKQFKTKMEQLANAERVVANLKRELEELEYELSRN